MPLVRVKTKFQVTLPNELRRKARLKVGDLLEAKMEEGKITLTPQSLVNRAIAEGLEDIRKGRLYGPFGTVDELLTSLKHRGRKRQRTTRSAQS